MLSPRITKLYYSILFVFSSIITFSYLNIAKGGAVFGVGPNIFYFIMLIFASSLIYVVLNSNYLKILELPGVLLFCLSLPLLLNLGIPQFAPELDSIITMQSINFINNHGFLKNLIGDQNFLISATYSLPLQSILGISFMHILNISYIVTAKYIPLILLSIFFLIYYAFISKYTNKKIALLSLILISTYVWRYSGVLNNVDLALVFFMLSMWLFFWREQYKKPRFLAVIQVIVLIAFALTHHLTYFIFVMSLIFLFFYTYFTKKTNKENIVLLSIVSMLAYYSFVYSRPLTIIIYTFTHQLINEGKPASSVTAWAFSIILQRISYIVFSMPPIILSIIELKKNKTNFLFKKYTILLLLGVYLFFVSVIGVLFRVPWDWQRLMVFGWMFYLPGAINILVKSEILKTKFIKQGIIIFISSFLVFGNLYVIPHNIIDHSGDEEYKGEYKNWIKLQEWESGLFLNKTINHNSLVLGDEVIYRIYASNSPNYKVNFTYMPNNFNEIKNSKFTYLVVRAENFYRIIGSLSLPASDHKTGIDINTYYKINSEKNISLIYNNKEVQIFHKNIS